MKKIFRKIRNKIIKFYNRITDKEWEDYVFLRSLCIEKEYQLNLDKYNRLMKMVKRKYRK